MLSMLLAQTATVLRYTDGDTDGFGNDRPAWVDAGEHRGRLRRLSAQEVAQAGETTTADWQWVAGPDVTLHAEDRLRIDGVVYDLDAAPYVVWSHSAPHHLEARLRQRVADG